MNLARAVSADLPEIVALMNRAYRGGEGWTAEQGYIQGDRISLEDLEAELAAKPEMQFLVWREDGALLGCVSLEPLADGAWYLGAAVLDGTTRGNGPAVHRGATGVVPVNLDE